ncbi:MAG: hypothetical protein OEL66_05490, partial [Desulfobulbaceae bacterium]|nr:hypothetical protein [Desulfobulbaceae bacterium]
MKRNTIKERLQQMIGLESLHSWDIEEHIDFLATLSPETREEVFRQIMAIWPVSYALCFAFLDQLPKGLSCLRHTQLSTWVNASLDVYETDGLQAASRFLADVQCGYATKLHEESSLSFAEVKGRLQPYLTGLAGYEISLATDATPYTDTTTIYLLPDISHFKKKEYNFLLYKLTVSTQWALLANGLFRFQTSADDPLIIALCKRYHTKWTDHLSWMQNFFALFPQPSLAGELFLLAETIRATTFLEHELPGLIRDAEPIRQYLLELRPDSSTFTGSEKIIEGLKQWAMTGTPNDNLLPPDDPLCSSAIDLLKQQQLATASPYTSAQVTATLYRELSISPVEYSGAFPIDYVGLLKPEEAEQARLKRREETKSHFIDALAAILPQGSPENDNEETAPPSGFPSAQAIEDEAGTIQPGARDKTTQQQPPDRTQPQTYITINDAELQLPDSLQPLLREIHNDLGHIP